MRRHISLNLNTAQRNVRHYFSYVMYSSVSCLQGAGSFLHIRGLLQSIILLYQIFNISLSNDQSKLGEHSMARTKVLE